jgi:hypothetical protein
MAMRLYSLTRASASHQSHDQHDDEDDQEDEEQDFGNACRAGGDSAKAERRGNDGDDEK